MTTTSPETTIVATGGTSWSAIFRVTEMWASLAIVTMWLAVLFDAVYGADFVSSDGPAGTTTTIPSAVAVALFAFLATGAVAKYGFAHERSRR
jgi:hypothetical protein